MSNRFHSKWHRTSHQTYKNPNILDAGWDPIASHDVPFSGDFVMAPSVSGWCISAEKNRFEDIYAWSPSSVITINAHYDPSIIPDPDTSTINLVAGIINFNINETNINGHLNVKDWVEISGDSTKDDSGYGLLVHESAVISGETSAVGKVTIDDNLYVTGTGEGCGSAYFNAISATEATIVSALIKEVDISASESNGYIMKTPNPQGKIIPNPLPGTGDAGKNNFYLSGDTLYSDSWGYFEGELKTASALYADGPVTFADTLNVSDIATFGNEIKAALSITTNKNLYVTGNAKVGAFGSFGTYVSAAGSDNNGYGLIIEKKANIKGNTDIGGTLSVTGAVDFDSTLNVDGATTLNSLGVTNNATVGGTLGVTGATTLSSTLKAGATTLDSLSVTGNETVTGTLGVTGATTLSNTLEVTGATTLNNTLKAGATTLDSLFVTGNATVGGAFGVTGATTLSSTLEVAGATTLNNNLTVQNGTAYIRAGSSNLSTIFADSISFNMGGAMPGSMDTYSSYGIGTIRVSGLEDPNTGTIPVRTFNYPMTGGTLATETYVNNYVSGVIGDINTILDAINGEEI